jgi:stringent starvation protein B
LLRAMHEWMVDNGFTPHIVVDARREGVQVPEDHIQDDKIVLNVSHSATHNLALGNDAVTFEARFGGRPRRLSVPVAAVLGIYARETGQGMLFGEDDSQPTPPLTPSPTPPPSDGRPKLKVVK